MASRTDAKRIRLTVIRGLFNRFAHHLRPHRQTLMLAALCMLGAAVMELLRPWPLKLVFDVVLIPKQDAAPFLNHIPYAADNPNLLLLAIALSILMIAILAGLFGYGQAFLTQSVGQKVIAAIRKQVYHHIQHLSHSFHDESRTGDLLARLTGDIRMMRELLVTAVMFLADRLLVVAGMIVIMLWMDWQLTLVALAIMPLLMLTLSHYARKIRGAARTQRRRESEINNVMTEKLSAITLVQTFARAAHEDERFSQHNINSVEANLAATRLGAHLNRLVQVIIAVGVATVVWLGVTRVQSGVLTAGDLLVFIAYLKGLYNPVRKLSALTTKIAKATVSGERILAILDTDPEIRDNPNAIEASRFRGAIAFDHVEFGYQSNNMVLRDTSFKISPGETVALVGASGSGKSTIASLLLRLYDPLNGRVLVDGVDIRDFTLNSLREQIAVVLQDSVLFSTTIADNIAYGKLDATTEEIIRAAKVANVHEFIDALPEGYDTVVGERGDTLSGGQRQRIAIARAIIRDAPIVILDEPTSGLDIENRVEVEAALARLTANSTCLIITHHMSSVVGADRLLRLEDGEILEIAADQLAACSGGVVPHPVQEGAAALNLSYVHAGE